MSAPGPAPGSRERGWEGPSAAGAGPGRAGPVCFMAMTYRPRPHDHLVEPIVSALTSESGAPPARGRSARGGRWLLGAIVALAGLGGLLVTVLVAG